MPVNDGGAVRETTRDSRRGVGHEPDLDGGQLLSPAAVQGPHGVVAVAADQRGDGHRHGPALARGGDWDTRRHPRPVVSGASVKVTVAGYETTDDVPDVDATGSIEESVPVRSALMAPTVTVAGCPAASAVRSDSVKSAVTTMVPTSIWMASPLGALEPTARSTLVTRPSAGATIDAPSTIAWASATDWAALATAAWSADSCRHRRDGGVVRSLRVVERQCRGCDGLLRARGRGGVLLPGGRETAVGVADSDPGRSAGPCWSRLRWCRSSAARWHH